MKKKIGFAVLIVIMILFVAVPMQISDLVFRIQFREFEGQKLYLYYGTESDPVASEKQLSEGNLDPKTMCIEMKIPAEAAEELIGMRIDFPDMAQQMLITDVSVSAAGVPKARYNPCDFFAEMNILGSNGIVAINNIESEAWTFITTGETDPFIVLTPEAVQEIAGHTSQYRLTRIGLCLLVLAAVYFYTHPIYKIKNAEEN